MTERNEMTYASSNRLEICELLRSQLKLMLEQENLAGAKATLGSVQPADIAEVIEGLPEAMQAIAFRLLGKDMAIAVYEYLDSSIQQALIEEFKRQDVLDVIDKMSPDDRARLLDELPAAVVSRLLAQLSASERQATSLLLGYDANTAGRIMTPEYINLQASWTITQAMDRMRSLARASEMVYYLYVTNSGRRLTGIVSLRDLVLATPDQKVEDVMTREIVSVTTTTDQEEVARLIQRYDFLAVPVVDAEQRLVGIITVDDVIDILERETTEDIYALGGVQVGRDNYFQTSLFVVARKRVLWLLILLFTNTFTSTIISSQQNVLDSLIGLAAFIPLLIGTGGNVGAQSSTVVIRGLSTAEINAKGAARVVGREVIVGAILGLMLSIVTVIWAYLLQGDARTALIVGSSLFVVSMLACLAGAALPFLFNSFKLDPALMSAPFITTAVDVMGVLVYFWIARSVIGWAMLGWAVSLA